MATVRKTIEKLRTDIRHADRLYYCLSTPEISDAQYDKLLRRLVELETENPELLTLDSPSQRVSGELVAGLDDCDHLVPMLSIENAFDLDELDKFNAKVTKKLGREPLYCVDYKIDGCAMSLIYEDGALIRAVTRGTGASGADITHNARTMGGVPARITTQISVDGVHTKVELSGIVEIRGEAFITDVDFKAVVDAQVKAGEKAFMNSRNATSGAFQALDPTECYKRKVRFVAHGFGQFDAPPSHAHSGQMSELRCLGVPVINEALGQLTYAEAREQAQVWAKAVDDGEPIPYPIDGIVLKVDDFADRVAIGQVGTKSLDWAVAYKWERYEAETIVEKLDVQVGKQGTLTPVAFFKPVLIAGTMVKKATLHNFDEVARLGIRLGSTVVVEKAGKIIPHVVRVIKQSTRQPRKSTPSWWCPWECPVCGAPVRKEDVLRYCTNSTGCPAQLRGVILAAADRSRLDIDGLGVILAGDLVDSGMVTTLADLWRLRGREASIRGLTRMGEKKTAKFIEALDGAKTRPSWRLLASLNIRMCGRTVSEKICKAIQELRNFDVFGLLQLLSHGELTILEGIGDEIASSIVTWFAQKPNRTLLADLRALGLNMGLTDPVEVAAAGPQPLAGKKICATGKLSGYSRTGIKDAIKAAGGTPSSSVSRSLDYLVVGEDAGSKLAKARALGVATLTEAQFDELLAAGA